MKRSAIFVAAVVLYGASAEAQTCTRAALNATAASYFKAVETDDMSALPTAPTARITENAAEGKKDEGFFNDWLDVHIFRFNPDGKITLIQSVDGPGTKGTGWPLDK
jgi:hypothetical protein